MKYIFALIVIIPFNFIAQNEYLNYRSEENSYYWKNRKPTKDYWQQDVHYDLKVNLNDSTDIIAGIEKLIYWNNSPDELNFVFFHLYSNAKAKGSYLADLYKNNNFKLKYGKYRAKGLGTEVDKISCNGIDLKKEQDNTLLKVFLNKPLLPGDSVVLYLNFTTYFDLEAIRNRMKMFNVGQFKHYDIVHWYPRLSCYDRKFGWDTEQHMDHEFYGDFGSYHVEMTLPNNYIIDGTGELMNEEEVLPPALRAKLDVSNFSSKEWGTEASVITERDGTSKTWIFSAINVHDAAYSSDPTYRLSEYIWKGISCRALVQEQHAIGWQTTARYLAKIIETNSQNIGMYGYPKIIAADAMDHMEYPMITLNSGYEPEYRELLIHETTHNWFFGMVGNNETYRAFMDEGITQFYSSDTWENLHGKNLLQFKSTSKYVNKFSQPIIARESEAFNGYYSLVNSGLETTMNTHSDDFNGAIRMGGGYGATVYFKTATMLYNLQYVLGDSLFKAGMQNYFNEWKFCHPYPEDFRNSFSHFTHVDLTWFFDEWMETSKTIDYKVKKVKLKNYFNEKNIYEITLERKLGSMEMPIDFTVLLKDSTVLNYHIPNNWFQKKTNATILPRWIGWGKVKPTYKANIEVNAKILNVIIDTTFRLADIDYTNNRWKKNIETKFDSKIWNLPNRFKYEMFARPALWYNGYDGIKFGANVNGNYLNKKHVFDATFYFNFGLAQSGLDSVLDVQSHDLFSLLVNYKTSTDKFIKKSNIYANGKVADGLYSLMAGFERKSNNDKYKFFIQMKSMYRDLITDKNYLFFKNDWQTNKFNNSVTLGMEHSYSYKSGNGNISFQLRSPMLYSYYDFATLNLTSVNKLGLGTINFNTRFFAQLGTGKIVPFESMLYTYGANPEEMMENKFTRAAGILPQQWGGFGVQTNHLAAAGGLNLRGFSGYLLPFYSKNGVLNYNYKGTSGVSINTELEFGKIFKLHSNYLKNNYKLVPYLFADAGIINNNAANVNLMFSNVMADAGLGFSLTILRWWKLQTAKPLTIRFDIPLFINRLPYVEKHFVQFRWLIGVSRAF